MSISSKITDIALRRWLTPEEICLVLNNWQAYGFELQQVQAIQSKSGTLLLYDSSQMAKGVRQDEIAWQTKKKGTGVREDHLKLKVNHKPMLYACYAHCATIQTFHRRLYRFLEGKSTIVLVHYLDDRARTTMFASTEQPLSTVPASPTAGGELLMDIGADATDIAAGMAGKDAQLQHPYSFAFDSDLLSLDGDLASMQTGALESIFELEGGGAAAASSAPPVLLDLAPGWSFEAGGEKVLACFECVALPQGVRCHFGTIAVDVDRVSANVLRMTSPPHTGVGEVELALVDAEGVTFCSMGSFEYRAPVSSSAAARSAHPAQTTNMIICEGASASGASEHVGECSAGSVAAQPQPLRSSAGKRSREQDSKGAAESGGQHSSTPMSNIFGIDAREFKIRLVERMGEMGGGISAPSDASESACESGGAVAASAEAVEADRCISTDLLIPLTALDDAEVARLSNEEVQLKSAAMAERMLHLWVELLSYSFTETELQAELNSLDVTGMNVLHYVSFYNYASLAPIILSRCGSAGVDVTNSHGLTALHLAAGRGYAEMVRLLVAAGANVDCVDSASRKPSDCARAAEHDDLAKWLQQQETTDVKRAESPSAGASSSSSSASILREADEFFPQPDSKQKLLMAAFSGLSLHDKCAISLAAPRADLATTSQNADILHSSADLVLAVSEAAGGENLDTAIKMMGPDEVSSVEEDARVIQHNVRGWMLCNSYKRLRDTTVKLQRAMREHKQNQKTSERDLAAQTLQSASKAFLARQQIRNATTTLQAATRGWEARQSIKRSLRAALQIAAWVDSTVTKGVVSGQIAHR